MASRRRALSSSTWSSSPWPCAGSPRGRCGRPAPDRPRPAPCECALARHLHGPARDAPAAATQVVLDLADESVGHARDERHGHLREDRRQGGERARRRARAHGRPGAPRRPPAAARPRSSARPSAPARRGRAAPRAEVRAERRRPRRRADLSGRTTTASAAPRKRSGRSVDGEAAAEDADAGEPSQAPGSRGLRDDRPSGPEDLVEQHGRAIARGGDERLREPPADDRMLPAAGAVDEPVDVVGVRKPLAVAEVWADARQVHRCGESEVAGDCPPGRRSVMTLPKNTKAAFVTARTCGLRSGSWPSPAPTWPSRRPPRRASSTGCARRGRLRPCPGLSTAACSARRRPGGRRGPRASARRSAAVHLGRLQMCARCDAVASSVRL